jgi:hypothetical protein
MKALGALCLFVILAPAFPVSSHEKMPLLGRLRLTGMPTSAASLNLWKSAFLQ